MPITPSPRSRLTAHILEAVALPWNAFVAAFVYYTLLTLFAIGMEQIPTLLVILSYLLPPALYSTLLLSRALRALSNLQVDIGPTPELLLH